MSARVLKDFIGVWDLTREIEQADGQRGHFTGRAEWQRDGEDALYAESGQLWLGGQGPFTAERNYRWLADLTVLFEDGRPFHRVPDAGGTVGHWCPPDQYDGRYDFTAWPSWEVSWQVKGPRKDYASRSRYTPCKPPET